MGVYESPEEILACAHHSNAAFVRRFDRIIAGLCGGAIYIHLILTVSESVRVRKLI